MGEKGGGNRHEWRGQWGVGEAQNGGGEEQGAVHFGKIKTETGGKGDNVGR